MSHNIFAAPNNDLFRPQGNNIFAGNAVSTNQTGYTPPNNTFQQQQSQPSWYNQTNQNPISSTNTGSTWRPGGNTPVTTQQQPKLGTYRAPQYEFNHCPTNKLHKLWTNDNFPVSICCLEPYIGMSPLELRIEDYYNIRQNNLNDVHRKAYGEAVAKKQFNDYIKNTNKPAPVPFTVNMLTGSSSFPSNTTASSNNNMFASRTGAIGSATTQNYVGGNITNSGNIFSQTQNTNASSNNIFTARQQTNNNALFTQQSNANGSLPMSSSTAPNIFSQPNQMQNQNQMQTPLNPFTSSTPNIFANQQPQPTNSLPNNMLNSQSNNIFNQSQMRNTTTFPNNSNNLFAQNTNSNNLFAQNPQSNNMFSNSNTNNSNNLFTSGQMMQNGSGMNMFSQGMGGQSMYGSQYQQPQYTMGGINLQTLFDLPSGTQEQRNPSQVFSTVPNTSMNTMMRSQPAAPIHSQTQPNPLQAFMAGFLKLYQSVYNPQAQPPPQNDYYSKVNNYSEPQKTNSSWLHDDGFKYYEEKPKQQKIKIVFVDQQPHKQTMKPRFDSISESQPYKQRSNMFTKSKKFSPFKQSIDEDLKRVPNIYSNPIPKSNKTPIEVRCSEDNRMQFQLELTSEPLQKIEQYLVARKLMRKYDTLMITNILVNPSPKIVCLLTNRILNLPPGYTSVPENPTSHRIIDLEISNNHGRIKWQGQVDIAHIDFSDVLVIGNEFIEVYEGKHNSKPAEGDGLNKPCTVTFFNCGVASQLREKGVFSKHAVIKKLSNGCKQIEGCEFVSYDDINNFWTFRLNRLP